VCTACFALESPGIKGHDDDLQDGFPGLAQSKAIESHQPGE
jgi:hypothetical protein